MWKPKQFCSSIFCHPDGLLTFGIWGNTGNRINQEVKEIMQNVIMVTFIIVMLSCFLEGYFRLILFMCIQRLNQNLGRLQMMGERKREWEASNTRQLCGRHSKLLSVPTSHLYLPSIISRCVPCSHP